MLARRSGRSQPVALRQLTRVKGSGPRAQRPPRGRGSLHVLPPARRAAPRGDVGLKRLVEAITVVLGSSGPSGRSGAPLWFPVRDRIPGGTCLWGGITAAETRSVCRGLLLSGHISEVLTW